MFQTQLIVARLHAASRLAGVRRIGAKTAGGAHVSSEPIGRTNFGILNGIWPLLRPLA